MGDLTLLRKSVSILSKVKRQYSNNLIEMQKIDNNIKDLLKLYNIAEDKRCEDPLSKEVWRMGEEHNSMPSVRTCNVLGAYGIDTIQDLVVLSEADLLRFRNFGNGCLEEVKRLLSDMSLHLGMTRHETYR